MSHHVSHRFTLCHTHSLNYDLYCAFVCDWLFRTTNRDVADPDGTLAVTLWRTAEGARDKMVGKVEVHLETLMDQKQHDQWLPLTAADDKGMLRESERERESVRE
jgi:hypothetical protein